MTHSDNMNFELFDSGYLVRIEPVELVALIRNLTGTEIGLNAW